MPKKKKEEADVLEMQDGLTQDDFGQEPDLEILSSKQEVADVLKMSVRQLNDLVQRYPFDYIGVPSKIMGRWRVTRIDVFRWFRYVQQQECRHPRAKRMRPDEPPSIASIKGR